VMSKKQLAEYTEKSIRTVQNKLNNLIELNLIRANGNPHDPKRTYEIIL